MRLGLHILIEWVITISRTSGLELWVMVYSNGRRKSFWNLKWGNSSFSKNLMASCRRASNAKKPTCGLLWQHTWISSEKGYVAEGNSTYLVKVLSKNFPQIRPLQTNTTHIVVEISTSFCKLNNRGCCDIPEDCISSHETSHSALTNSTIAVYYSKIRWLSMISKHYNSHPTNNGWERKPYQPQQWCEWIDFHSLAPRLEVYERGHYGKSLSTMHGNNCLHVPFFTIREVDATADKLHMLELAHAG